MHYLQKSLFAIVSLLSFSLHAHTINLAPNESKSLTSAWTLNANCTSQSTGTIRIEVLKNHGRVNGKNLNSGQGTSIALNNHRSISVNADAGTEINLINLSNNPITANCST